MPMPVCDWFGRSPTTAAMKSCCLIAGSKAWRSFALSNGGAALLIHRMPKNPIGSTCSHADSGGGFQFGDQVQQRALDPIDFAGLQRGGGGRRDRE